MTELDRAAARARLAAATPAPWSNATGARGEEDWTWIIGGDVEGEMFRPDVLHIVLGPDGSVEDQPHLSAADADLVANAPGDLTAALDLLDEQQDMLEQQAEVLKAHATALPAMTDELRVLRAQRDAVLALHPASAPWIATAQAPRGFTKVVRGCPLCRSEGPCSTRKAIEP